MYYLNINKIHDFADWVDANILVEQEKILKEGSEQFSKGNFEKCEELKEQHRLLELQRGTLQQSYYNLIGLAARFSKEYNSYQDNFLLVTERAIIEVLTGVSSYDLNYRPNKSKVEKFIDANKKELTERGISVIEEDGKFRTDKKITFNEQKEVM